MATSQQNCDLCLKDSAVGYCDTCDGYLCETCVENHSKSKLFQGHTTSKSGESTKSGKQQDITKDICKAHSSQFITFYCEDHDILACATCMMFEHKNCPNVKYLMGIQQDSISMGMVNEYTNTLQDLNQDVERIAVNVQTNTKKIETNHKACMSEVVGFAKEIEDKIKALQRAAEDDIRSKHKVNSKILTDVQKKCTAAKSKISARKMELDSQMNSNQYGRMYVTMKRATNDVTSLKAAIRDAEQKNVVQVYQFRQNSDLKHMVKECKSFGVVGEEVDGSEEVVVKKKEVPKQLRVFGKMTPLEDCVICMDVITKPKTLTCGHVFCSDCIDQQFKFKQACPICGSFFGIITGDQPHGRMCVILDRWHSLAGSSLVPSIAITYAISGGEQTTSLTRQIYFQVGTLRHLFENISVGIILYFLKETGVYYEIHGYPDPYYLDKVTEQLAHKGVTKADVARGRQLEEIITV